MTGTHADSFDIRQRNVGRRGRDGKGMVGGEGRLIMAITRKCNNICLYHVMRRPIDVGKRIVT